MHSVTTSTQSFIDQLQAHLDKALVFEYAGKRIQPGYHVTEIKAASFRSLDCGANPQEWHETIVQLWDVADEPERGHMSVHKFMTIYNKVNRDVHLDTQADIKFECGDDVTPAVHYQIGDLRVEGQTVRVVLEPVRATCKPRDRMWLEQQSGDVAGSCCGPNTVSGNACCTPAVTISNTITLDAIR